MFAIDMGLVGGGFELTRLVAVACGVYASGCCGALSGKWRGRDRDCGNSKLEQIWVAGYGN